MGAVTRTTERPVLAISDVNADIYTGYFCCIQSTAHSQYLLAEVFAIVKLLAAAFDPFTTHAALGLCELVRCSSFWAGSSSKAWRVILYADSLRICWQGLNQQCLGRLQMLLVFAFQRKQQATAILLPCHLQQM